MLLLMMMVMVRRFLMVPMLGDMLAAPAVRVLVIRRYLVSSAAAAGHRTGHVVPDVLLGGCGGSRSSSRGRRPGLLVAPVLAAAALRPATPVLLPGRLFVRHRHRWLVFRLRGPRALLHPGTGPLLAPRLAFAPHRRVLGRFVVFVLRKSAYLGGPEGLMEVWQPAVGLLAATLARG